MNTSFFGRLTKDPEVKTSQNGITYTAFTVATQVRAKGDDGKNKSIFVNVSAFGKTGEIITQYFHKGSRIVVHGDVMDINAWTGNNDGQAHAGINITMSDMDFVDTKAESQQGYAAQPPAQQSYQQAPAPQAGYNNQPPAPRQNYQQPSQPPQPAYAGQPAVPPQQGQAPWNPPAQQNYQQAPAPQQSYQNAPY